MGIFKNIAGNLLDWSGIANVPAALTALASLKGKAGQIIEIGGVDAQGGVTELVAVDKPGGGADSGQNLELDTTLTQRDKAADAKATGDAIKKVEEKIPSIEGLAKAEDIPTKPEDIGAQPQGNYASPDDIPRVPTWAMQASKPGYTASEVGADPQGAAASAVNAHNASGDAHTDLRLEIQAIREQLAAFLDVDEETLNELSELIARIVANQTSIEQLTTGKVSVADIVNNLTTDVANKPLSAAQGVAIKALIDGLSSGKLDASKLTEAINTALAQAKASGEFDGAAATFEITGATALAYGEDPTVTEQSGSTDQARRYKFGIPAGKPGKPGDPGKTPVRGVDYWTPTDKAEIEAYIATELAKRAQLRPEPAESLEWLRENGNYDLIYVLPNGNLCMWLLTEKQIESGPAYTNRLPLATDTDRTTIYNGKGYKENTKLSGSGGGESTAESGKKAMCSSGFIFPVKSGDILRIKGIYPVTASNHYIVGYDASNARTGNDTIVYENDSDGSLYWTTNTSSGKYTLENNDPNNPRGTTVVYTINTAKLGANVNAVRVCAGMDENTIITLNEEIEEGGGTTIVKEYDWVETGLNITPPDYEPRVIKLEKQVKAHTADIAALQKGVASTTPIKTWDTPIYDANIPVFTLSAEKAAIIEAEKTVAGVYAKYDALMARHPQYITKTDLGMCSDGVTPVYRYDFREPEPHRGTTGKKEWSETKAKAIIVSGIHWEWGGIFALYNALEELADNPDLFALRRNTHLIVLPLCNPYAVANMSVRNANLVEIHRNFEVDFIHPGESGYIELGERSHGGTEPLSEIETQYMDTIMRENQDAAFFLTCHSYQSDNIWGTGFLWASPATYYCCNLAYRVIDKVSKSWMDRFGDELAAGIADYRTENLPEWDTRFGSAYLSTTNGTETKQATKYGMQALNLEVCDTFWAHGTKADPEPSLSAFAMSRGAEAYVNLFLTAFGVYDPKDKKEYAPATV